MPASLCRLAVVAALLPVAGRAQEFVQVPPTALATNREVQLARDLRFRIDAGAVVVVRGDRITPMPSTAPTGAVHELARLPLGTVVAAAERGLFACDAEHPVLDPVELPAGLPPGPLLGVGVDAAGRTWTCSADRFGVVDLRLRLGRMFTAADGLPPGPFHGVAAGDGSVRLRTAAGEFAYRPDQGPPPRLVGGPPADAVLRADGRGELPLPLAAEGRGGAAVYVRRRHHHLLLPMVGDRVTGLRPGRHVLETYAIDRDLRTGRGRDYTVEVSVPPQFDPRRLLPLLGAALVGLFVLAYRAAPGAGVGQRVRRASVRVVVLAVVLIQVTAAFAGYGRSWPFVGFSMYTENWHRGDVLHRPRIVGHRANGERVPLHEGALGIVQDGYWQMLGEVVFGPDTMREQLWQRIVHGGPASPTGSPFVAFTLADGRIRLTEAGPVDVAPTILVEYRP